MFFNPTFQSAMATIWIKISELIHWFSPLDESYPNDDVGKLMHRYMDRENSWLDTLSKTWVHLSSRQKIPYFAGAIVLGGFIGILFSAPSLFAFIAGSLSLMTHAMFNTIEKNRFQSAKLFAEELIPMKKDYENKAILSQQAREGFLALNQDLTRDGEKLIKEILAYDQARQNILESHTAIIDIIDDLKTKAKSVIETKDNINGLFRIICEVLQRCHNEVLTATHSPKNNGIDQITKIVEQSHEDIVLFVEIAKKGLYSDQPLVGSLNLTEFFEAKKEKLHLCDQRDQLAASLAIRLERVKLVKTIGAGLEAFDEESDIYSDRSTSSKYTIHN